MQSHSSLDRTVNKDTALKTDFLNQSQKEILKKIKWPYNFIVDLFLSICYNWLFGNCCVSEPVLISCQCRLITYYSDKMMTRLLNRLFLENNKVNNASGDT